MQKIIYYLKMMSNITKILSFFSILFIISCSSQSKNNEAKTEQKMPESPQEIYDFFVKSLKNKDYVAAQTCLYEDGVYFFTLPKLKVNEFTETSLDREKGQVLGAYAYSEDAPEKFQTGKEWLNYFLTNFNKFPAQINDNFRAGSGYEGNMASDHLLKESIENGYFKAGSKILTVNANDTDSDGIISTILLVEFVQKNGKWRIYAVGDWEWTP